MKRSLVPALLALASLCAAGAGASGPSDTLPHPAAGESGSAPLDGGDGRRTLKRLPANLGRGLVGMWSVDNLVPALAGGTAAATASLFDADARDAVTGQLGWSDSFETAGGPVYSTIFVAGMFTAGRFAQGARFRAMTYDMLGAAVVDFAYCAVIKELAGRERPNGEDDKSFPSGHTSNAFAMATVAERHYGWKVGVPAYALAGLMGLSRMHEDKHWLSDVVAGAALGYIAGRTVVRVNGQPEGRRSRAELGLSPIVARRARGMVLSVSF